ncbi:MAG: 3',5'-nucleoside bisphosphate phosphatase [Methylophilaceae bacterium]|nr:3',5'-nucleoside bisphosphate phosphatase [Methylophilaceae bacterium]MDG1445780.1 3',5'-nucleoside bisphosphate phosphatase [Methylophilaceae bacterium]MDG1821020.1 3',5'-nucleoside bisphosphate phosphatase [Methylophilaceae bacterium]
MPATIDLHCHSTISDGLYAPEALVAYAHAQGVKVMALTDHDDIGGLSVARAAAERLGMRFINGVEISVTWKKRTIHIVGLRIDPEYTPLKTALAAVRHGRLARAKRMAEALDKVGIPDVFAGAQALAGNSIITRSHIARYLVEAGYVKDVKTVFKKYLVKGKPGFVDHEWMSLAAAVTLIKDSGGVAVVAHPGRYDLGRTNMPLLIHQFRSCGGEAIEVVTGSHTPPQYTQFAKIAHQFSLKASLGSDFHGPGMSYIGMGQIQDLPANCIPVWQGWEEADCLN